MGTWIEYRCENRAEKSADDAEHVGSRCYSHTNDGPMEMANDNRADISKTLTLLDSIAKDDGWKKTKEGWICPYCVAAMKIEPR